MRDSTKRITYGAATAALSVVLLFLAQLLQVGSAGFLFLAALVPVPVLLLGWRGTAAVASLASCVLSLLLLPDKLLALPYVCFLAWYAIVHSLTFRFRPVARYALHLAAFDVGVALWYGAVSLFLGIDPLSLFGLAGFSWVVAVGVAGLQIVFLAVDWLFGMCESYIASRMKRF